MLSVKDEENVFITEIKKARQRGKKVYILGAALGATRIAGGLKYWGLDFDGFVVDYEYYSEGMLLLDKDVYCMGDVIDTDCIIIRSIANYPKIDELKKKAYVVDEDVLSLSMVASDPFDMKFVKGHFDQFNSLYDRLSDEKSRQVMTAYLNQKITGRFSEMENVWGKVQYFDGDFYDLVSVYSIVDCGAFIGDSFLAFCNEYERISNSEYGGGGLPAGSG